MRSHQPECVFVYWRGNQALRTIPYHTHARFHGLGIFAFKDNLQGIPNNLLRALPRGKPAEIGIVSYIPQNPLIHGLPVGKETVQSLAFLGKQCLMFCPLPLPVLGFLMQIGLPSGNFCLPLRFVRLLFLMFGITGSGPIQQFAQ
ncbi:MAG: hypothetical protein ACFNNL_02705 [Kingella oralis]